jgi:fibronectin-binding autotransporter adhesin
MKHTVRLRSFLAFAGSALLVVSSANATQFWDGTGSDAFWNTPANWGGDALPAFTTTAINFGSLSSVAGTAFGGVVIPSQTTANNDLTAGTLIVGINFGNNGQANRTDAYTLQGSSIAFGAATNQTIGTTALHAAAIVSSIEDVITFDIDLGSPGSGQNRQFQALSKHYLKFDGVISGGANAGVLIRVTDSKVTLTNANNSYLGFTNISEGTGSALESVLEITSIANGGSNSSIGASSNAAGNLRFNFGFNDTSLTSLRYIGSANASTDRLFTLYGNINGTNSRIESSGEGTLSFTNTGEIASGHARGRNFYLGGTNTGDNTFAPTLSDFNVTELSTFTKQGDGKWILTGAHSYTGATTVTGGKLSISSTGNINSTSGVTIGTASTAATTEFNYNSSTALTQAVSFAAGSTGGTVSGTGTINMAVNVTAGNTLAIGNSVGVMNFGDNLELGGTYLYELNSTLNTADLGDVAGNLTLGGILDLVQLGAYTAGDKFTLFAYDGTLSGLFKDTGGIIDILDDTDFTDAGGVWRLNYNDTTAGLNGGVSASNTYVTITAIPEPRAALLGGLGLLALLRRRR